MTNEGRTHNIICAQHIHNYAEHVMQILTHVRTHVDQCRQKFMTEFEQWYELIYGGGQSYEKSKNVEHTDVIFSLIIHDIGCTRYWRKV